jgi:hypothetical protein
MGSLLDETIPCQIQGVYAIKSRCYRPNYLIKNEPSLDRINGSPTFGGEILTGLGQIK